MKIGQLSDAAQDGLRLWAEFQHGDGLLFDDIGSSPQEWAWICVQLRVAEDRPEWFPKGRWATIQVIEGLLLEQATAERREEYRDE